MSRVLFFFSFSCVGLVFASTQTIQTAWLLAKNRLSAAYHDERTPVALKLQIARMYQLASEGKPLLQKTCRQEGGWHQGEVVAYVKMMKFERTGVIWRQDSAIKIFQKAQSQLSD